LAAREAVFLVGAPQHGQGSCHFFAADRHYAASLLHNESVFQ
jgi:hypothetical protein